MKKSIGDIYLDEIHEAILRAGGGPEGVIDVQAAAMACAGVAASLVGALPRTESKAMAKHIATTFQALVSDIRKDIARAAVPVKWVTQQ